MGFPLSSHLCESVWTACICVFVYLFVFSFEAKCIFVRHVFGVKCDRCAAHLNLGHFSADYFTAGLRSAKEEPTTRCSYQIYFHQKSIRLLAGGPKSLLCWLLEIHDTWLTSQVSPISSNLLAIVLAIQAHLWLETKAIHKLLKETVRACLAFGWDKEWLE